MRKHLVCESPAILLVAMRVNSTAFLNWAVPEAQRRPVVAACAAMGMDWYETPHTVLLTAGTCDVEGPWRRARPHTRAEAERWHAVVHGTLAFQARERAERQERRAARAIGMPEIVGVVL